MKKIFSIILSLILILFMTLSCGVDEYILNERTFFLVMTNMQYYPEQYLQKPIEYDCFTYDLTDTDGRVYRCGVRKCSSGYGCNCGKDTVIGFILDYGEEIPEPKNQSEDTPDKTWIHVSGTIASAEKTKIKIYSYNADGEVDYSTIETIEFLSFKVETLTKISDYSDLNYYVTK